MARTLTDPWNDRDARDNAVADSGSHASMAAPNAALRTDFELMVMELDRGIVLPLKRIEGAGVSLVRR
ncbi:MAG: hypothetical protein ACR2N7_07790 [Acidimicrobiia bacterium]